MKYTLKWGSPGHRLISQLFSVAHTLPELHLPSHQRRFSKEHKPHCELRAQEGLSCQLLMRIILKPSMGSPPHPVEKLPSIELVSGARKVRDHCSKE